MSGPKEPREMPGEEHNPQLEELVQELIALDGFEHLYYIEKNPDRIEIEAHRNRIARRGQLLEKLAGLPDIQRRQS